MKSKKASIGFCLNSFVELDIGIKTFRKLYYELLEEVPPGNHSDGKIVEMCIVVMKKVKINNSLIGDVINHLYDELEDKDNVEAEDHFEFWSGVL